VDLSVPIVWKLPWIDLSSNTAQDTSAVVTAKCKGAMLNDETHSLARKDPLTRVTLLLSRMVCITPLP
jgi:hypothetical protein